MAGRVTIQDIADALGISRNTVSKAINNTGILADATREKILQKAVEMGYKQFSYVAENSGNFEKARRQMDPAISYLTPTQRMSDKNTNRIIALFTSTAMGNSHFYSTMLDNIQRELSHIGYSIAMYGVRQEELTSLTLPNSFNRELTSAIICTEMLHNAYIEMLCTLGIPILFVNGPVNADICSFKADRLLMDNRSEIYSFMNEMVNRGKTQIGFIGEYRYCMSFFERYMAFVEAQELLGLPHNPDFCICQKKEGAAYPSSEEYQNYLMTRFKTMKQLPEVFICANDFIAIDVLQVFRRLGISVPDDVWLCGFGDTPESRIITPPLTTIHIHGQVIGYSAVHMLLSRIQNPTMHYRTIYTETSLVYRESTGD
jgi:LacI family transcriptional regulator